MKKNKIKVSSLSSENALTQAEINEVIDSMIEKVGKVNTIDTLSDISNYVSDTSYANSSNSLSSSQTVKITANTGTMYVRK